MQEFLISSECIDWQDNDVLAKASQLANDASSEIDVARNCFLFVRDQICHSLDFKLNPISCKASEVLKYGTGYCYAKSHLLAALLRANKIPAGLCYQRLSLNGNGAPFCLHGLNAAYFQSYGWYRFDARGNKAGVNATFVPPLEQLAFPICEEGEANLPEIWAEPLAIVVKTLTTYKTYDEVANNLPDITLFKL